MPEFLPLGESLVTLAIGEICSINETEICGSLET